MKTWLNCFLEVGGWHQCGCKLPGNHKCRPRLSHGTWLNRPLLVGSIALCGLLEHMYLVTKLLEASDMFITFASLWFLQVDLLGDEVDNLVALLERVSTVLEHYSPVLQHYPGVAISQLSFCRFSLDCCYCSHFFIGFLGGQPGVFSFLL